MSEKGVFTAKKKDGTVYYRASFTYKNKHISLGSFYDEIDAHKAYEEACILIKGNMKPDEYVKQTLPFDKYIIICNFRDNNIYIPNPLYIRKNYISYYLSPTEEMKFSIDDLFYYISHKILRRGGHLYVNDYGMQLNLKQRYGIKNYAVINKDFSFVNGDLLDYRYENIEVYNTYAGVEGCIHEKKHMFRSKIHINGDVVVGYYDNALIAAIAYNKAVDILKKNGINKNFAINYIDEISAKTYADIYSGIIVNTNILNVR